MSFERDKYLVIRGAISKEIANFAYEYFLNKRIVAWVLAKNNDPAFSSGCFGTWEDSQIPGTYSHYADIVMETLLQKVKPVMEKHIGFGLVETYSYARIYKTGDILHKHKDRASCEISTTLNLGGPSWPIFLEPDSSKGTATPERYIPSDSEGVKVVLEPGDMLIYRGCDLEHWRDAAQEDGCTQVFLHYNDARSPGAKDNELDRRQFIGLPSGMKAPEIVRGR